MTLTSCSGERPPRKTATRVSFLLAILYPNPRTRPPAHDPIRKLPSAPRAAQSPRHSIGFHRPWPVLAPLGSLKTFFKSACLLPRALHKKSRHSGARPKAASPEPIFQRPVFMG